MQRAACGSSCWRCGGAVFPCMGCPVGCAVRSFSCWFLERPVQVPPNCTCILELIPSCPTDIMACLLTLLLFCRFCCWLTAALSPERNSPQGPPLRISPAITTQTRSCCTWVASLSSQHPLLLLLPLRRPTAPHHGQTGHLKSLVPLQKKTTASVLMCHKQQQQRCRARRGRLAEAEGRLSTAGSRSCSCSCTPLLRPRCGGYRSTPATCRRWGGASRCDQSKAGDRCRRTISRPRVSACSVQA